MKPRIHRIIAITAAFVGLSLPAFAASGNWNTTVTPSSWNTAGNWLGSVIADGSGFTANFNTVDIDAHTTITLDGARTIGNLIFGDTDQSSYVDWILSNGTGGSLTLAGAMPTITVNQTGLQSEAIISATIHGSNGLTKSGVGTVLVTGANDFSGGINVSQGVLSATGAALKNVTGAITVASGSGLYFDQQYNGANPLAQNINIGGSGNGSFGALNLGGNATAGGAITLDADATISHDWNSGTVSGAITGTNRNLELKTTQSNQPALLVSGAISLGTGAITVESAASGAQASAVILASSNSYSGGTILSSGTLNFSHVEALGSGAVRFTGNSTLQAGVAATLNHAVILASGTTGTLDTNGRDIILGGALSGSGNLIKLGAGKLTLTGANTYTGTTTVAAGTLALLGGSQASPITLASGAALVFTLGMPCTSTSSVDLGNGTVRITNTPTQPSHTLMTAAGGFIGAPTLDPSIPGFALALANGGTELRLVDEAAHATVPNVVGMERDTAIGAISSAGLDVGTVSYGPSVLVPDGQVISQSPAGGAGVLQGSEVNLVVSSGDPGPPYDKYVYKFPNGPTFVASDAVNNTPRDLILQAISSGATEVTIPPGIYRMTPPPGEKSHISISNANNLTINAYGVVMLCDVLTRAINISDCQNLVINGLTIDYSPIAFPFTQGEIIATGKEGDLHTIDIRIHEGYPVEAWGRLQVFDPVLRAHKIGAKHTWDLIPEMVDAGQRIVRVKSRSLDFAEVGDLAMLSRGYPEGSIPHTVEIGYSAYTSFHDVTIHTSISFGIAHGGGVGGGEFKNVRIVRGPIPPGATEPRLLTTMHDGWKLYGMQYGPLVEDCIFEHTGDDAWSTSAQNHLVAAINGNRVILLTNDERSAIQPGFHLRRGPMEQELAVTQVTQPLTNATDWDALRSIADNNVIDQVEAANGIGYYGFSKKYYELELAAAPTFSVGDRVMVKERQNDGYVFRNNRLYSTGRLLLSAGSNGLIENNELIRAGIEFSPEMPGRANGMKNIIFRNNYVELAAVKETFSWDTVASGSFAISTDENGSLAASPFFFDFQIYDNVFVDCANGNMNITGTKNLTLKNNRFVGPGKMEPTIGGAKYPFDQSYVINLFNSSDVVFHGNTLEDPGVYCKGGLNSVNTTYAADPLPPYTPFTPFAYVNEVNDAPVFFDDPISKPDAKAGTAFSGTIADRSGDADLAFGDILTFSKVSGPGWLTVAANGALGGTPSAVHAGLNTFMVRVQDSALASATATLNVWVTVDLAWDGGGAADNWSNPANWNAAANDNVPDSNTDTAVYNYGGSINIALDGDFTIKKFQDGYDGGGGQTVAMSGPGTLTFDANSASPFSSISNATGGPVGCALVLDCGVVINNSLSGETQLELGNSSSNIIRFGANSTLSLLSPFNTAVRFGTFEFNGRIVSGTHDLGLTGNVVFGAGHDSSTFNKDILLNSTSKLTINAGTVLAPGRKFQIYGTGSELELNGANVVNGPDVSVGRDHDFLIDVNAAQDDFGSMDMGTGTVTIDLAAGVGLLAFADSSGKDWTGGNVVITNFRKGVVRFGTHSGGITADQLTLITARDGNGVLFSGLRINSSGFLTGLANEAPVASSGSVVTNEDTAVAAILNATDGDGDPLTFSVVTGPANGTLSGTAPNLTYTPAANFNGTDSFTFKVNDGALDSPPATVSITVSPVNDVPVFAINPFATAGATESLAYTGQTLAGKATDADAGDTITYSKVSGPAWLVLAPNGTLSGTPPNGSAGLNTFSVRATDSAAATATATLQITVTAQPLPLPWLKGDIGTGMLAGSVTYNSGTFTHAGSGVIGSSSDRLNFTYQTLTGDGEIIARISVLQNTGTSSRVGVMIRDTLAANSKHIFMGMTGTNAYRWVRRTTTGGNTSSSNSSTGTVPNTWVRLVRAGTTITAYKSINGTTWTSVGSSTSTTFASTCYIGLAVSSGSTTTLNTSQFSNVTVNP